MLKQGQAVELVSKFYYRLPNNGSQNEGINNCTRRWNEAIECALVCIDQLKTYSAVVEPIETTYWDRFKEDILNLKK